jgi:RHS repeat-associated protein
MENTTIKQWGQGRLHNILSQKINKSLYWLLGDHSLIPRDRLGSQAITTDAKGSKISEVRYYPWGGDRYNAYTSSTMFRFTGQRTEFGLGLYYYGARWYDSYLNRWIQPDPIIPEPNDFQSFDRYAYALNNPVRYTDPSGYFTEDEIKEILGFDKDDPWEKVLELYKKRWKV